MTAVTHWQGDGKGRHFVPRPLPEPPRYRRVSKIARQPLDRLGRALEDWLRDYPVTSTLDAD